jgi:hypothetical protein
MAQYTLLDLTPQGHSFRDTDGLTYDVPTARMFGTLQFGRLHHLQAELPAALAEIREVGDDEERMIPAVQRLDQVVNEFFRMLAPKMPPDRVYEIPLQDKIGFIEWWQREEEKIRAGQPTGEAQAGQPVSRGRRSPASSRSTKSTRNGS